MIDISSLPTLGNIYIVGFFLTIKYTLFQKDYIANLHQKKKDCIRSIDEDTEQLELSYVTSEDINWFKHFGKLFSSRSKS